MSLRIKLELQKFIDDQVKDGRYDSTEEVVEAALATIEQQTRCGEFGAGELDRLLAEGETDFNRGNFHVGEDVFREISELSAARRREQSN
ncbi:MAG TPA: type II toxin-antitoxin system ParD family antitoxin [Humisphaera sp.]|nr:type II toxin-antitoxin system ParD family antitoxin [Humisphaera sp.]